MKTEMDRINDALSFIPADDRNLWLRIGMAVKSELGESGFDLWDSWSKQADSYHAADALSVWKSIQPDGGISLGTLFHEAKNNGWQDDDIYYKPTAQEISERKRISMEHAKHQEEKDKKKRSKTASKAQEIWSQSSVIDSYHPYLLNKKVSPVLTMREIPAAKVAAILGYAPKSDDEPLIGRLLVIPIKVGSKFSTLELIDEEGRKTALSGKGTKTGGYWAAQSLPNNSREKLTLLIGEGAITVLSAKEATGYYAIAALSSCNLVSVSKSMRESYPNATLIILADLVKATGEVEALAIKAAQSVNGLLAIPDFGIDRAQSNTDFNDMVTLLGMEAVKQAIINATNVPIVEDCSTDEDSIWPKAQPLLAKMVPEPYPLDALPSAIRAAIEEVQGFVKAPVALVAASALAAVSLAIQAQVDVKRAEKLTGPAGLFLLTIADSGERKSTCDGFFSKAIRDYDDAQAELAKPILKNYNAAIEGWQEKKNGIKDKIRQLAKKGESTICLEDKLRELEHEKPEPPRIPRLMYSDATPEALAYNLAKTWPSGGIISAEAGIVFGGHSMSKESIMRNLALLNVLWDGGTLTIDRRTTESFTVRGARLTIGLQVQEATLHSFFDRSGALARGTGFLARFLFSWPESTQGYRPFTEAPINWPALEAFNQRMTVILNQLIPINEIGMIQPILLTMSVEAKEAWVVFHDEIEKELINGGELYDVRDVASKIADNAARLAILFHVFEMPSLGVISLDAIVAATRITAWHLNEAQRFFGELALPAEIGDAIRLDNWLINYCQRQKTNIVPRREIQRHITPIHLRKQEALDNAFRELVSADRIFIRQEGKRKIILVNPEIITKDE